jgi:hypothetical protein
LLKKETYMWLSPGDIVKVLSFHPRTIEGGVLFIRAANWREHNGVPAVQDPEYYRIALDIMRRSQNPSGELITITDRVDLPLRGMKIHVTQRLVELTVTILTISEYDYDIVSGFYDGPAEDSHQDIVFYGSDYEAGPPPVARTVKIADYAAYVQAHGEGILQFTGPNGADYGYLSASDLTTPCLIPPKAYYMSHIPPSPDHNLIVRVF